MGHKWEDEVCACDMTVEEYREALEMLPSAACLEYQIHNCDFCDNMNCSDNTSEARKTIKRLEKEAYEKDKQIAALTDKLEDLKPEQEMKEREDVLLKGLVR
jgi:predicted RNase H-like nuclease (RuvC/YqgF family)